MTKTKNNYLLPFILVTSHFFLWGIANNLNGILIPHLRKALQLSNMQSTFVDTAVYLAYFLAAIPAGIILKKFGYKKAVTTIRHHIEILKNSGLIEISKIEEARGGITKYYGTSTKLLDFTLPADFDKNYSKLISKTSLKLGKIVGPISKNFSKTRKIQQINYNNFIIMEIVNRAMTDLLVKK